jgi:hypothetical protein
MSDEQDLVDLRTVREALEAKGLTEDVIHADPARGEARRITIAWRAGRRLATAPPHTILHAIGMLPQNASPDLLIDALAESGVSIVRMKTTLTSPTFDMAAKFAERVTSPAFAIVWDPELIDPDDYAELIEAIGDLARACGAAGIQRIDARGFEVPANVEVFR